MPPTPSPITVTDVGTADAARALTLLGGAALNVTSTAPERWAFPLLQLRTAGQVTLRGSLVLARHLVITSGNPNLSNQWSVLAAVECLGQVDASTLTEPILAKLIQQAHSLAFGVFGANIKTLQTLRATVAARKTVVTGSLGDTAAPWLPFLDRVGDALVPVLGQQIL